LIESCLKAGFFIADFLQTMACPDLREPMISGVKGDSGTNISLISELASGLPAFLGHVRRAANPASSRAKPVHLGASLLARPSAGDQGV
jgi:hypothetical protein